MDAGPIIRYQYKNRRRWRGSLYTPTGDDDVEAFILLQEIVLFQSLFFLCFTFVVVVLWVLVFRENWLKIMYFIFCVFLLDDVLLLYRLFLLGMENIVLQQNTANWGKYIEKPAHILYDILIHTCSNVILICSYWFNDI